MRDVVRNKERCKRRRSPTQDPSTDMARARQVFGGSLAGYATLGETMMSLFRALLGDFDVHEMTKVDKVLGPPGARPAPRSFAARTLNMAAPPRVTLWLQ